MSFIFLMTLSIMLNAQIGEIIEQSEELGQVHWLRDYNQAVALAERDSKPILILFQEVPGCSTCRNYGQNVLSHPLMVEAIENEFIPLAIFNNKGGKDKKILEKFSEPSWNNPVVRIVDVNGVDLINRIAGDYSAIGLLKGITTAIHILNRPIPEYIKLLGLEIQSQEQPISEQYFQMYCFWSGEKELGQIEGVVSTETGFQGNNEVVKVRYLNYVITDKSLINKAKESNIKTIEGSTNYKSSVKDIKYYLQQSDYRYLALTEIQKTKINSALGMQQDATVYLSPKQKVYFNKLLQQKTNKKILFDKDFTTAWTLMRRYQK